MADQLGGTPPASATPVATPPSVPAGNSNTPAVPSSQPPTPELKPLEGPGTPPAPVAPQVESQPGDKTPIPGEKPPAASEQLLADLPPEEPVKPAIQVSKPTLEALKLPEKHKLSPEDLADIVSRTSTQEEAQKLVDMGAQFIQRGVERLKTQNQQWIAELKNDPEFGKSPETWAESKALYAKGIVKRYGRDFAKLLLDANIDAHPAIFKDTVRQMRASNPSPIVAPENPPSKEKSVTFEGIAQDTYGYMKPGARQTAPQTRGLS